MEEKIIKELIRIKPKTNSQLEEAKRKIASLFKVPIFPNTRLFLVYQKLVREKKIKPQKWLERVLRKKPIRSFSGIVNISVLTKPYPCPGNCIFCPIEAGFPKSYLSGEPAADRAKNLSFDPYLQVKKRIETLREMGHATNKIELRIVGGTFSFYPRNYRIWFLKKCFEACNQSKKNERKISQKELEKEQRKNEKAKNRIVGISIETRPDSINEKEIKFLRELGITMVEMGVQSVFDEILEKNRCYFKSETVALATQILKDAGFKVLYHLMPNLLGSNFEKDLKMFEVLFSNEKFKPDWIKIYPTVVVRGSKLYQIWKERKYKPYSDKELIELLIKIKTKLPKWVRVARILRDIPATKIEAGCKISNLREVVQEEMKKRGLKCSCIRCREVREKYNLKERAYLFREDYEASGGKEIFLSFEKKSQTKIFSSLRLRIPSFLFSKGKPVFGVLEGAALIRELKTFGEIAPIGKKVLSPQHRGLGKRLIKEAERITKKEFSLKKIAVISGIGVREYWRKLGYKLKETYMVKEI